jgi:hypothetical protein
MFRPNLLLEIRDKIEDNHSSDSESHRDASPIDRRVVACEKGKNLDKTEIIKMIARMDENLIFVFYQARKRGF